MRIPKFILGLLLSTMIGVSSWAGKLLLDVKDRVTRIETTMQILLPASRTAGAPAVHTNQLAKIQ